MNKEEKLRWGGKHKGDMDTEKNIYKVQGRLDWYCEKVSFPLVCLIDVMLFSVGFAS